MAQESTVVGTAKRGSSHGKVKDLTRLSADFLERLDYGIPSNHPHRY